jgi:hypothetical protein
MDIDKLMLTHPNFRCPWLPFIHVDTLHHNLAAQSIVTPAPHLSVEHSPINSPVAHNIFMQHLPFMHLDTLHHSSCCLGCFLTLPFHLC